MLAPRPSRLALRLVAALLVVASVAGCSGGSAGSRTTAPPTTAGPTGPGGTSRPTSDVPPRLTRFYDQTVAWRGCGDGFQCARVTVPLDYAEPEAGTLRVAVTRLRSSGGSRSRIGSLFLNPGGPGVSGFDYARAARSVVTAAVRRRYDVVGFDPRGVGRSAPVRCLDDERTDEFEAADGSPDDAAEEAALVSLAQQFGRGCLQRNPRLLAHLSTADAARDLDVLRSVVGDRRLHYVGKSYGTFLGAIYAELFPTHVGRLVLDGVVDPADSSEQQQRAQAIGFEGELAAFVDDCLATPGCPLTGNRGSALAQVRTLLDGADRAPLRAERPVTQSLAVLGIARAMYSPDLWPVLRRALAEAKRGNGGLLLALADDYLDRDPDGHYTTNTVWAIYAISCLDRPDTGDVAVLRARAAALAKVAPTFGPYVAWGNLPCGYWPVPPALSVVPVHAAGSAPILVVGTTRDPATPYSAAVSLARELDRARLLTFDGDGHTAYGHGSSCIDRAVDGYLLGGRLPREGLRCH